MGSEGKAVGRRSRAGKLLIGCSVLFLPMLVLMTLGVRSCGIDSYSSATGSMRPTIEIGENHLVNKLAYGLRVPFSQVYLWRFEGPRRGDLVVFLSPRDQSVFLKRVVALPGDRVRISSGRVILNGKKTNAPDEQMIEGRLEPAEQIDGVRYELRLTHLGGSTLLPGLHGADASGEALVPEEHYLLLGDNRGESRDGRSFGWVHRDAIVGRCVQ